MGLSSQAELCPAATVMVYCTPRFKGLATSLLDEHFREGHPIREVA